MNSARALWQRRRQQRRASGITLATCSADEDIGSRGDEAGWTARVRLAPCGAHILRWLARHMFAVFARNGIALPRKLASVIFYRGVWCARAALRYRHLKHARGRITLRWRSKSSRHQAWA